MPNVQPSLATFLQTVTLPPDMRIRGSALRFACFLPLTSELKARPVRVKFVRSPVATAIY